MKISQIINYPLNLFGIKIVRQSSLKKLQANYLQLNYSDIEQNDEFMALYEKIKDYTLVGLERCYALYSSVKYILQNNIDGDFVECGVWKGGSSMLVANMLVAAKITDRNLYMYDTFSGMTEPGEKDGKIEKEEWSKRQQEDGSNSWCYSTLEEVKCNIKKTGYPFNKIKLVQGKVEETIPLHIPEKISLLRLDTDWYESTKHELIHLFPIVQKSGILFIDDYGTWPGAKKATDEYFTDKSIVFLNRIDHTGRLLIK